MFTIPQTDLQLSDIALGTVKAGITYDTADDMIKAYMEKGGNIIDTARVYSDWIPGEIGRSERVLGDAIKRLGVRNDLVLLTKGGHPAFEAMHTPRMSAADMRGDLLKSLKALQTDVIDIYMYHRDDPSQPVSELIETMETFRKEGKIRYYACSNWSVDRMREADAYCKEKGYRGFVCDESLLNAAVPCMGPLYDDTLALAGPENLAYHKENPLNILMPYSAVADGFFHRWILKGEGGGMFDTAENRKLAEEIRIKAEEGASITGILLDYFKTLDVKTIPVFGPRDLSQLEDLND